MMKTFMLLVFLFFSFASVCPEETGDVSLLSKNKLPEGSLRNNLNLIVIIDVSKSMIKNFQELQNYTRESIIGKVLIDKDYFDCFTFGQFIRPRIEKTVSLPDDMASLKDDISRITPDENFTDIGLALETLGNIITLKKLPYERTIVFFITDGKNAPPKNSKYSGVDIYATGAFKFYSEIKSGDFKVMLLSIGNETAATDLSQPLGAEFIEVSSTLLASDLNDKIKDFIGSIEMNVSLKDNDVNSSTLIVKLSSDYSEKKEVKIKELKLSIDDQKIDAGNYPSSLELNPGENKNFELNFKLPDTVTEGDHIINIELSSENNIITKSLQKIRFEKKVLEKSEPIRMAELDSKAVVFAVIAIIIMLLAVAAYVFYMLSIVSIRNKNKK